MPDREDRSRILQSLDAAVEQSRAVREGEPASYIPELTRVPLDRVSAAVETVEGAAAGAGDVDTHRFTLQSSAKLILLSGLLEERGESAVFNVVGREPSGTGFSSLARLETHDHIPSNPVVNAGAIAIAGLLPGTVDDRIAWVRHWTGRLLGAPLPVNETVRASERESGDRNRAIAYFLKSYGVLKGNVDDVLEVYFALCSLDSGVREAVALPALLARGGVRADGERVLSRQVANLVVSIMATCGMYDESGAFLQATGMAAKSGVSGVILAVAPGKGGIAVSSPRINARGGSIRGHLILRAVARDLDWHFASGDAENDP